MKLEKHHIFFITFGVIYISLFAFFYGWKAKRAATGEADLVDMEQISDEMKQALMTLKKDTSFTHYFDTLSDVYAQKDFRPLWMDKVMDSAFAAQLQQLSDSIVFDGFKREHYQLDTILALVKKSKKRHAGDINKTLAHLEIYISNAFVAIWHDKVIGRTDPRAVLGGKYTLPFPNHPGFNLLEVLNPEKGLALIRQYEPVHIDYGKLKKMLIAAYGKTAGSETMIDTAGIRKLKPGDTSAIVPLLAVRLVELGLAPDSFVTHYKDSVIYGPPLVQRITEIQKTSNLTDDGIIGKSTLKLLNASENDKIGEIRANMERIRWFGTEPVKPYVRVNLPEFMLYMYYPDSVKTMPVCIGKGKERYYDQKTKKYKVSQNYLDKPLNHETPQVFSNIDFVILNPTWTVPSSIVGREMYNLILKNPGYLTKNNFQVFKDRKPVDPYSINWRKLSPGNIPYTIRQNSGDDNSLGKIKFTFKNPFDVYLHDTPLKSKFKLNNRAVSHGCVRVQSPVDLAGFVLQGNLKVTYDDVLIKMGLPPTDTARAREWSEDTTSYKLVVKNTYPVRLENKMTVFFDYRTIVFDEFDRPRLIFDVYDKNRQIVEAMDKD